MTKTISLFVALVLCLSFVACSSGNDTLKTTEEITETLSPPTEEITETLSSPTEEITETLSSPTEEQAQEIFFEIGKETVVNNFTFTVNEIGFADSICIDTGDTIGMYSKNGSNVHANEGYGWLYFSISYKFTGKKNLTAQGQFLASVQYEDYFFMTPNLRFFKYDELWHGLDYQWGKGTSIGLPLPATNMMYEYDPWVEKDYELHGAIQVATKAVEDTETPLVLRLHFTENGNANEQMNCIVKIDPPAELTPDDRLTSFSYEDREFFKEYVQTLTPLTEDEIYPVLVNNTFKMRNNYGGDGNGTHSITFYANGSLDADYSSEGKKYTMFETWTANKGTVVLYHSFTNVFGEQKTIEYVLTPYQYDSNHYLLIHHDGDYSMVLTIGE